MSERLTKKVQYNNAVNTKEEITLYHGQLNSTDIITKLGKLEDIEEELGVDLVTLFKAIKDGIYHNQYDGVSSSPWDFQIDIKNKRFYYTCEDMGTSWDLYCYFKDYGKTWALTKEELEK